MEWSEDNERSNVPQPDRERPLWQQFNRFVHGMLFSAVIITLVVIGVVAGLVWMFS